MTDLNNQILNLKKDIEGNRISAERFGVPKTLDIAGLEKFLEDAIGGNRRAEANQVLQNLIKLRNLEQQNIHQEFTYNYTSIYGTFTTSATSELIAYAAFQQWLKEKEAETPEPTPEPIPEPIPEPEPTPEPEIIKDTWWVIRPSGIIEQLTVTQKFKDTMTAQGWIFSKEKPMIEEPQNQNISIVFYIGKGGDLKTHFDINSIVVTPDEAEQLAGWLFQNYNTKILFVMNRLTDDIRTHTQQQLKDLIVQKLKDDQPVSDDITEEDIKKPQQAGLLGAGVGGAIGILILIGMLADSRRKR